MYIMALMDVIISNMELLKLDPLVSLFNCLIEIYRKQINIIIIISINLCVCVCMYVSCMCVGNVRAALFKKR